MSNVLLRFRLNKTENVGDKHHLVMLDMLAKELGCQAADINDFELCLYDTQKAAIAGANDEFLNSARLDNLMMSFCALNALLESVDTIPNDSQIRMVALFDNEEVGSQTAHGADSNLLETTLKRLSALPIGTLIEVSFYSNNWWASSSAKQIKCNRRPKPMIG
jgi:aspartyl aminopeptidase